MRIDTTSAILCTLFWSIVMRRELSCKAKLSAYWLVQVPTLTYDYEFQVTTEKERKKIADTGGQNEFSLQGSLSPLETG